MSVTVRRPRGAMHLHCIAARAISILSGLGAALALATCAAAAPFYMGADISLATFFQEQNTTYYDNGVAKPVDKILYDHGANLFRLRIFVNPETEYTFGTGGNFGAIQTFDYDLALAQQIKANAPNAKLLLDFHYSDTWADPGKQFKPADWTSLTLPQLQTQVRDYTRETILAFEAAGVRPDMVQVGNEVSNGLLWETGRVNHSGLASWVNAGSLINHAIQGVRQAQGVGPKIDVAVHIDQGDRDDHPQYYFGNLTNPLGGNVSDFDIVGVSYYAFPAANRSFALLEENLTLIAGTYPTKKIMILETNYAWKDQSGIGVPAWAETPAGQAQFLTDLRDMMLDLPNNAGAGIVWWYPESVTVPGYFIHNGGSIALFDNSHNALPALNAFHITLTPGDFNRDGVVDAADYTVWRNNLGDANEMDIAYSGDGVGGVNEGDYAVWRANYGRTSDEGGGGLAGISSGRLAVPEPASAWWLLIGLALLLRRSE